MLISASTANKCINIGNKNASNSFRLNIVCYTTGLTAPSLLEIWYQLPTCWDMWRVGQHNECVCMRQQTFGWECRQVCCSWKIVFEGVYSRQCPDVIFNVLIDYFFFLACACGLVDMHVSIMFFLLHVCVPQVLLILWMWIRVYLYCTSAEPADCSTSSQVMWNVSGTEHRMCSSGPQRAVRAHTHSLSHSVIYMLAH